MTLTVSSVVRSINNAVERQANFDGNVNSRLGCRLRASREAEPRMLITN